MKVLVTGAAGFIGSNIVKLLESKGAKTIIFDNFSHSSYKNLDGTKGDVICADILDAAIYKKLPKVDAIIHEAAITDTTLLDDTKMMMVNFEGFKNVFNYSLKKKIKLVYASSAGVYGNGRSPMSETQEAAPHNTYAYSKYLCDVHSEKVSKVVKTPLVVGVRYFNVYGPNEYHKGSAASMTYQLYLQMKNGKRPRVFKHGEQKRDFIYVKDVARITVEALNLKKNAILNVGTGTAGSFNEIIAALNKSLNKNLKPDYFDNPYADVYQDFTQADIGLLKKLGIAPEFDLRSGIKDYVINYLEKEIQPKADSAKC
ncbi:MAG: ADP-glyceromanno-heptose 6-epimerase [Candidatus Omnitrophica bacterium]|nr:ADP-glyceromanno-heptose 6-epimerase [Candidatus Omnitrophota bacterium]